LKTELDKELLNNYSTFNAALEKIGSYPSIEALAMAASPDTTYHDVCLYLSVHELMALGVRNKAFDGRICYKFWNQVLSAAVDSAAPVIEYVRRQPYCSDTYSDLLWLDKQWKKSPPRWWKFWR
jgi:hypothetical protein